MAETNKSPSVKRLRLTNDTGKVPPDVAPDNPPLEPGSDEVSLPSHLLGRIDAKAVLLQLLQTEAGTAYLINALRDPRIRDALRQRGVTIATTNDVGYNSLPLELRDQIRGYVIEDLLRDECVVNKHKCSHRLSAYACVDAEWRAAIEAITFRSLTVGYKLHGAGRDFDIFMRHVTGNRQRYLQRISLGCMEPFGMEQPDDSGAGIALPLVDRLFTGMEQWPDAAIPDGGRRLELDSLEKWAPYDTQYDDYERRQLSKLPCISQFTSLVFAGGQVRSEVVLGLLSRLPQLRDLSIVCGDLTFLPGGGEDDDRGQSEYAAQVSTFFADLSHHLRNLEGLEVATNMQFMGWRNVQLRSELISFSQKLQRLSLRDICHEAIRECLAPFCTKNFDPNTPPRLSWPNLTNLHLDVLQDNDYDNVEEIREVVLIVGRIIRCMPRLKYLQLEICYVSDTYDHSRKANSIFFSLDIAWDDNLNGSRADLFIHQRWHDHRPLRIGPLNMGQAVASEEVRELWRESLLKGANAVLEVDVQIEDDWDEDGSDEDDSDEVDWDVDDVEEEGSQVDDSTDED